ncbi:MAG: alpha/beta fold hydrolase [Pseudomonadota bacterium]
MTILHGLFGSGRNWNVIARRLSEQARVWVPDLRNHGASPHSEPMTYPAMAADVRALLDEQGIERSDMIGHSMGGKAAMWLALTEPERVNKLVVVDIAPVRYAHSFRNIIRTLRRLPLDHVTGRADADGWLAQHIPELALRQFLLQNLIRRENRSLWRINLDGIERALPALMAFPEAGRVRPFHGKVLFVAGGRSNYILPEHTVVIRRLFPHACIERLPDAGHWLHSEQPEQFMNVVQAFLT